MQPSSERGHLGAGFTDDDVLDSLRERRSTVSAQLDALDQLIEAIERARATGALVPQGVAPPAVPAARQPRERRPTPVEIPPVVAEVKEDVAPALFGQYDAKILACVKLAPPLGLTAKDIVKGVAGRNADQAYGTVHSALQTLAKRGLIRKDGRYYLPPEAEAA